MAYVFVKREVRNDFGRKVGGTEWEVSVCTDQGMTTAASVKIDSAGVTARPNDVPGGASPGYAQGPWQYLLGGTLAPAGTTVTLESTTGIRIGDRFQVVEGAFSVWLTVKTIVDGTQITVAAAPNASGDSSAHTYTTGATAGDPHNLGDWAGWMSDAADVWVAVKKVGTTAWSSPKQWKISIAPAGTTVVITIIEKSAAFNSNSATYTVVTGLSQSVNTAGTNNVEYIADGTLICDNAGAGVGARIQDTTSAAQITEKVSNAPVANYEFPITLIRVAAQATGAKTIEVQVKTSAGIVYWNGNGRSTTSLICKEYK